MDNLALTNIVQTPVNASPQASGGAAEEAPEQGAFGQILAKQLSGGEVKKSTPSGGDSEKVVAEKVVQPIDLLMEIVDPATLAEELMASAEPNGVVGGLLQEDVVAKDKLIAANEDDDTGEAGAIILPAEVIDARGLVGNVQPNVLPGGKELPTRGSGERFAAKAEIPAATATNIPRNIDELQISIPQATVARNDLAASVSSMPEDAASAEESFAVQFDKAISTQMAASQDAKLGQAINNSVVMNHHVVTHKMEQTANSAPSSAGIPQQVGSPHWDTGLGDRVVWMIGSQTQTAQLHLNPPSLGPLEVRVSLSEGQANLSFTTHQVVVKDAIDAATPKLREMMGESGVQMGSVSVNVGNFSQQQAQQESHSPASNRSRHSEANDLPVDTVITTQLVDDGGLVNLFA